MEIEFDPVSCRLKLGFAYRKALVEAIKMLPDRVYNPETKIWAIGVNQTNLSEILALLAAWGWERRKLNEVEAQVKQFFGNDAKEQWEQKIKPPLIRLGELVVEAYLAGSISQVEQDNMLSILNHLCLRDFVKA